MLPQPVPYTSSPAPAPTPTPGTINIDQIIGRLTHTHMDLSQTEIKTLIDISRDLFINQPTLVTLPAPILICGDLHGQFRDLLRIFVLAGPPTPTNQYLFLGDYVDRGKQSTQCICLLLAYKIKYPHHFYLLRGNHECASLNRAYGFYHECSRRYSIKLWKSFVQCFNCMPAAALVSNTILCMHGGLSPNMFQVQEISDKIKRPCDIGTQGLLCDLLWADPLNSDCLFGQSDRGAGYTFGKQVVDLFCQLNNIQLIVRAHQIVQDGYQFSFNQKLITIFSAPNYCNNFNNDGGILKVAENLQCSILRLPAKISNPLKFTININEFTKHQSQHKNQMIEPTNNNHENNQQKQKKKVCVQQIKTKRIQKRRQMVKKVRQKNVSKFRSRSVQNQKSYSKSARQFIQIDEEDQNDKSPLDFVIEIKNWNSSLFYENVTKLARTKSQSYIHEIGHQQVYEVEDDDQDESVYIDLSNDDDQMMDIQ